MNKGKVSYSDFIKMRFCNGTINTISIDERCQKIMRNGMIVSKIELSEDLQNVTITHFNFDGSIKSTETTEICNQLL